MRATPAAVIVLIRHGQTVTNAKRLLVGRSDPELTELGRRQSVALRPLLDGVVQVWASPLQRARDTAALALPHLTAEIVEDFIEVDYGELDGQPLSVVSAQQWRVFESDHAFALGGGESLASVDARVHARLDRLLENAESLLHSHHRHLAIVSHVSPIKSAATWALGVDGAAAWRTRLDNGSLTVIGMRDTSPSLVRFNVVPLLEESE
jgi:broad specificity phosphatase PhoE